MATRPELIEMCQELEIDHEGLSSDDMRDLIRKTADKKLVRRYSMSADNLSVTLKKFLSLEYDYIFLDKHGNEYDYRGNLIKEA